MQVTTLQHTPNQGWSGAFPPLDGERTLILAFGAKDYGLLDAALDELRQAYPRAVIAGCSSSGEVLGSHVHDDTLVVAITQFERTSLRKATTELQSHDGSEAAGAALAAQLAGQDLTAVLVLSDGLNVNGTCLTRGIADGVGSGVIVTGGLASDDDRFQETWALDDAARPTTGIATAVGLYGTAVRVLYGSQGGWDTFGPERLVTRSENNVVFELDHQPALDLYKDYLGQRAEGLPATGLLFPLSIREEEGSPKALVRTILGVDQESRSMTFAGDVPAGCLARLMKANFDRLVDGAAEAAEQPGRELDPKLPTLAIAVSCIGRRLVLGERVEEEIEAVLEELPAETVQVGFYSYGEISPSCDGVCDLHNQTMTLTAIQELLD